MTDELATLLADLAEFEAVPNGLVRELREVRSVLSNLGIHSPGQSGTVAIDTS